MCLHSGTRRRLALSFICLIGVAFAVAPAVEAAEYYVAPEGRPSNPGTRESPLDLATALSRSSPARPGDMIWLRGGIYKGTFKSYLAGTPQAPITVRQVTGERATLDGNGSPQPVLEVFGQWIVFWGFELTNSHPRRISGQTGPWPSDLPRGAGVVSVGPYMKFINLVAHDLQTGLAVWTESVDTEVYGSIVYNNGWDAPDRSHGHGIYTQNRTGTRLIRENILFNQFSHGIHAYGSDAAFLDNITLEGNVAFNNGIIGSGGFARDLLLGGGQLAHNPVMRENYTYGGGLSNLGYAAGCSNGVVEGNYFAGSSALILVNCRPTLTNNVFYSTYAAQYGWQSLPVIAGNTYHTRPPTDLVVKVRPNVYEPGRAHVIVYNWPRQSQFQLDLSPAGIAVGDPFEIRDAQNLFGPPVVSGTYNGGAVAVPMTGLMLDPPIGNVPNIPLHTAPEFGVFVVLKSVTQPVTPDQPTSQAPPIAPVGEPSQSAPTEQSPARPTPNQTATTPPSQPPTPSAPTIPPTVSTAPNGATRIVIEAETGSVTAPMTLRTDTAASGGGFVSNVEHNQGSVTLTFKVPVPGEYVAWLKLRPNFGSYTSLFISIDGAAERQVKFPAFFNYDWRWLQIRDMPFSVWAGNHTVRLRTGMPVTRIDSMLLTNDPGYSP